MLLAVKFQNCRFGPLALVAVTPLLYAVLLFATSVLRFLVPAVFHLFFFSVIVNSAVTSTDQEQCRMIFSIFFCPICLLHFFCLCLQWYFVLIHRGGCTITVCTVCKRKEFCNPGNSVGVLRSLVFSC